MAELNPFVNLRSQVFLTFAVSFLLSPFNTGAIAYIIAITLYEVAIYLYHRYSGAKYNYILRLEIILASILGWLAGRFLLWTLTKIPISADPTAPNGSPVTPITGDEIGI